MRLWIAAGAVNGLLAVVMGSIAAHALRSQLPADALMWIETGSRYGLTHGLALLAVACLARQDTTTQIGLVIAGWGFVTGTVLFSGTLYVMGLAATTVPAMIVPFGGLALMAGWGGLLIYCATRRREVA